MLTLPKSVEIYVLASLYGLGSGARSADQIHFHLIEQGKIYISPSSIFPALNRLKEAGYVDLIISKYRKKTAVYRITSNGEAYFVSFMNTIFFSVIPNFKYESRKDDFEKEWYCEPCPLPKDQEDLTPEERQQESRDKYNYILNPILALTERIERRKQAQANAKAQASAKQ